VNNGLYEMRASRKNTPRIFGSGCFSRVASRQCLEQFICPGDMCRPAHNLVTNHEWSRTTALTARSAYVKTLVSRPVILTRKKAVLALAVATALTTYGLLNAQQPGAPAAPAAAIAGPNPAGANASKYNIAVVDISYIFKKHERFKATMEQMKKEMEGIEGELKGDREKIAALEQQRNQFNVGTAEYKKMEDDIAQQMAQFNLKMVKLRKEFLEREAKVYYQTYLEVVDAVKYYAKRQNIGLVLRFNGEAVDPNRRDDVLREINKPVVVQDQIDITPDVLALINRDQQNSGQAAPANGVPPQAARPTQIPR